MVEHENTVIYVGDALNVYPVWDTPHVIISDGAYGIGGFPGDPKTPDLLPDWYEPHVKAWTEAATNQTALWFWNTEVGWANVHPLLVKYGWEYKFLVTWDKGIQHVAGNVNSKTIRTLPVVTEVCAYYVRPSFVGSESLQNWLLSEWKRTGLPQSHANIACGVKNAASRKYLTKEPHNWYPPPEETFKKLADYANKHGDPAGKPYFEYESETSYGTARSLDKILSRPTWNHQHGLTNVFKYQSPRGKTRLPHPNQKPLEMIQQIIQLSTNTGDVVWEPFGGTCPAAVAGNNLGRRVFTAEINPQYCELAKTTIAHQQLELSIQ